MVSIAAPASADQISDAKAQAAAITAKLNAAQAQIAALSGQVNEADYKLAQLQGQIASSQAQMAKDQRTVASDVSQLQVQAIADYTSSGTSNTATQLFTSNVNTSGIRSEYSSIATGNVTSTIDHLHTAQAQLASTQSSLEQQKSQAQSARDSLAGAESQASALASQDQSTLDSVDANIQALVAQQQAAQAAAAQAAAQAAFNQKVQAARAAQAAQAAQATQTSQNATDPTGTTNTGSGSSGGGGSAPTGPVPPLSGAAAVAVQAAESQVGVPYVWGGASPSTGFDCSGLVMWAYAQAGISLPHYSGAQYDDTTHIPLAAIEPGDLLFYGPGGSEHVAMYVGGGSMVEAPYTGADVHITGVRTDGLTGVGRVV
ncbi:MAG: NlpC/P60 family protein [Acidimicrobiales bacterium]|jgi:cell wall-associated NlpC family hydrolase